MQRDIVPRFIRHITANIKFGQWHQRKIIHIVMHNT
jgi:hypothetical protein